MPLIKTLLGVTAFAIMTAGLYMPAAAQDFVIDKEKYERHQAELNQAAAGNRKPVKNRFAKGTFSGSSAYGAKSQSKAVVRNSDGSISRRGMLPRIKAPKGDNTILRYGDSSQSQETRLKRALNN